MLRVPAHLFSLSEKKILKKENVRAKLLRIIDEYRIYASNLYAYMNLKEPQVVSLLAMSTLYVCVSTLYCTINAPGSNSRYIDYIVHLLAYYLASLRLDSTVQ